MSAPAKPWESSGMSQVQMPGLQQQQQIFPGGSQARYATTVNGNSASQTGVQQGYVHGTSSTSAVPRPPPRPASTTSGARYAGLRGGYGSTGYSNYGGYGSGMCSPYGMSSGYGSYGSSYGSPYSSYGMMGSYGGYGSYGGNYGSRLGSMGHYGQQPYNHGLENRFIQLAEENSRPAFESLESLVHAFGSVSMMLESTFFAIHSSFRAVLGVAENFGRMRGLLAQVFSALTIFRAVRWAANRLLELLRLRKPGAAEQVWAEATTGLVNPQLSAGTDSSEPRATSAWPIVMFMSLVMGGPYLIWKLLRSVQSSLSEETNTPAQSTSAGGRQEDPWMSGRSPCYIAQAAYSFQARQEDELSFMSGDVLAMAPSEQQHLRTQGWMLAIRIRDSSNTPVPRPSQVGLVPTNHFRTLYSKTDNRPSAATPEVQSSVPVPNNSQSNNTTGQGPVLPSNLGSVPEGVSTQPQVTSPSSQSAASQQAPPDSLVCNIPPDTSEEAKSDDSKSTHAPHPQD